MIKSVLKQLVQYIFTVYSTGISTMKKPTLQVLSKILFVIGLSLLFILAIPETKGIIFSLLSLVIGLFAIVFPMKYENKIENNHSPLLFDLLMITVFTASFFTKEVPERIYPVFICWLLCFILNVVSWLVDKQYKGKDVKQLISYNLRLPLIVDILIIVINVMSLVSGEVAINNILAFLLIVFSLIDSCRQFIMVKRGKLEFKNLF